jgi:hypothetical protein
MTRSLQGVWGHFRDILIADCTVIRLHRLLEKHFKGCRSPAGAKVHVVMSVKACGASTVKISDERTKETRKLVIGSNIEGIFWWTWVITGSIFFLALTAMAVSSSAASRRTPIFGL